MTCDIIIPVWNQLEYTKRCIDAIQRNTEALYQLILVDNASDEETKNYLKGLAASDNEIRLIRNEENLGFIKAINQGLRESSGSAYVCIMNNDTVPAKRWLSNMIELAEGRGDIGMVNPQSESPGALSVDEYGSKLAARKGEYIETNQCLGFSMLVKREVINRIGMLDEVYGVGGFDDTDFSMRAHKAGYKSVTARGAYVYHDWHTSFKKAGNREKLVKRNEKIFFDRWGKYLRIAYPIINNSRDNLLCDLYTSVGLAREWNWVHMWLNPGKGSKEALGSLPNHQNMRIFSLPKNNFLFFTGVLLKLIGRRLKGKKQFDAVLVSDPGFFKKLSRFRWLFKTPLVFIDRAKSQTDITNENSWNKRARTIMDLIKTSY